MIPIEGIIDSILGMDDFDDEYMVALEADDITGEVADETKNAGGSPVAPADQGGDGREAEDLEKTDDIFGTEEKTGQQTGGEENQDPAGTEDGAEDDTTATGEDDLGGEDDGLDDTSASTEEPPPPFINKNNLRDSALSLYSTLSGDIETASASLNDMTEHDDIATVNAVLSHFRKCKAYLYNMVTTELEKNPYEESLQKYISIKRVYELCAEMLKEYFGKAPEKADKNDN